MNLNVWVSTGAYFKSTTISNLDMISGPTWFRLTLLGRSWMGTMLFFFKKLSILYWVWQINNVVIVPGKQGKDSSICTHVSVPPKLSSPPGCHITYPVLYGRSLLVLHFKYSSVHMSIPNSQTIPSPHSYPWQPLVHSLSLFLLSKFICKKGNVIEEP